MNYSAINNPVWASQDKSLLDCIVQFDDYPEPMPFTASPDDEEDWGRQIFKECSEGLWGEVKQYSPPDIDHKMIAEATKAALQQEASEAMKPLAFAEELGVATETEKALLLLWKKYCVDLYRIDIRKAPDINWPVKPESPLTAP